jgi:outer membrane lipoprotein-sorting protein
MVKKVLTGVVLLAVLFIAAGCGAGGLRGLGSAGERTALERMNQMMAELHSYRAIATVEYRANKGSNAYETVQHARITGEYRVEVTGPEHVAGAVTVNDGRNIVQFNARAEGRVAVPVGETPERSELFLTTFIRNYLHPANEVSVMVADMEEGVRTVLEAAVPGNHPYLATARLWVDNETLLPIRLIILDPDGAERIIVTYHVIELNVVLDDALFSM